MNTFYANVLKTNVKSNRLIMRVFVAPSFRLKSLCLEVHEMAKNTWKIFGIYGVWSYKPSLFVEELKAFRTESEISASDVEIDDILKNPDFIKRFSNDIFSVSISDERKEYLADLLSKGIPIPEHIPHGLDGLSYIVEIFDSETSEYSFWCVLPEEWKVMKDVLDTLFDEIGAEKRYYPKWYPKEYCEDKGRSAFANRPSWIDMLFTRL